MSFGRSAPLLAVLVITAGAVAACWPSDLDRFVQAESSDVPVDAAALSPYASAVLADMPSAYWPMDDAPGSFSARDVVGNHPAVTSMGEPVFGAAAAVGTGVRLDGNSQLSPGDYFDIVGASTFAIEFWARPDDGDAAGPNQGVVSKGDYVNTPGYVVYFRVGRIVQIEETWYPDTERKAFRECPVSAGFAHVVATLDEANAIHLYVNGVEDVTNETTADGGPVPDNMPLYFGVTFHGVIDELALYDHALTAERVAVHYHAASH